MWYRNEPPEERGKIKTRQVRSVLGWLEFGFYWVRASFYSVVLILFF